MAVYRVFIRYREKNGELKFDILEDTKTNVLATLNSYLQTKDPHSLLILAVMYV